MHVLTCCPQMAVTVCTGGWNTWTLFQATDTDCTIMELNFVSPIIPCTITDIRSTHVVETSCWKQFHSRGSARSDTRRLWTMRLEFFFTTHFSNNTYTAPSLSCYFDRALSPLPIMDNVQLLWLNGWQHGHRAKSAITVLDSTDRCYALTNLHSTLITRSFF